MTDAATVPTIEFSSEQADAIEKAREWFQYETNVKPVFQFTGYAGTGKTTCIKELIRRLDIEHGVVYAAFTGKAALVMKRVSGVPATTIHSLIYKLVMPDEELLEDLTKELEKTEDESERARIFKTIEEERKPRFVLKHYEESFLYKKKLLVLDECSMVNADMLADLKSYGVPIIAIGDPGQLPPIEGTGALFQGEVDVTLTEIHRQAAGNPIIAAATKARNGEPWQYSYDGTPEDRFYMGSKAVLTGAQFEELMRTHDQMLCGMHKTRRAINMSYRRSNNIGGSDPYPVPGDRIILRRNYRDEGLFNGLQAEVLKRGDMLDDYVELYVQTEIGEEPQMIRAVRAPFDEYYDKDARQRVHWSIWAKHHEIDFAYCLTVHVSQGSQWDHVLLLDDGFLKGWGRTREEKADKKKQRQQWLYTAVTRAAEKFTCVA